MGSRYPSRVDLFKKWAKAMEEGATVGTPKYPGTGRTRSGRKMRPTARPRRGRARRRRRAKKAQE